MVYIAIFWVVQAKVHFITELLLKHLTWVKKTAGLITKMHLCLDKGCSIHSFPFLKIKASAKHVKV